MLALYRLFLFYVNTPMFDHITFLFLFADLQPPLVRLTSYPTPVSNKEQITFYFRCLNEWKCSYKCSAHIVGEIPQYTMCARFFTTQTLSNGGHYEFTVIATDGVGNVGPEKAFRWIVGACMCIYIILTNVTMDSPNLKKTNILHGCNRLPCNINDNFWIRVKHNAM